jgi:hypothetical protein
MTNACSFDSGSRPLQGETWYAFGRCTSFCTPREVLNIRSDAQDDIEEIASAIVPPIFDPENSVPSTCRGGE